MPLNDCQSLRRAPHILLTPLIMLTFLVMLIIAGCGGGAGEPDDDSGALGNDSRNLVSDESAGLDVVDNLDTSSTPSSSTSNTSNTSSSSQQTRSAMVAIKTSTR